MELKDKIKQRELEPYHVLLASMFAGLNEMSMLNQASVNVASRRAGRYIAEYARNEWTLPSLTESLHLNTQALLHSLNELLKLGTDFRASVEGRSVAIRIGTTGCRYCPKGVGEAELAGTLCPYPGIFEEFVNALLPPGQRVELRKENRRQLTKRDNICHINLV